MNEAKMFSTGVNSIGAVLLCAVYCLRVISAVLSVGFLPLAVPHVCVAVVEEAVDAATCPPTKTTLRGGHRGLRRHRTAETHPARARSYLIVNNCWWYISF